MVTDCPIPLALLTQGMGWKNYCQNLVAIKMIRYSAGWKHPQITLENTYSYLKEKKVSCLFINPYQVRRYRQALGLKIKTDSVDLRSCSTAHKG